MYGNPEVTAGGNALKFYSSVRIDIRRKEILKENDGIMVKIKVVKNKVRNFLRRRFLKFLM
jgi:recombination protein RecA